MVFPSIAARAWTATRTRVGAGLRACSAARVGAVRVAPRVACFAAGLALCASAHAQTPPTYTAAASPADGLSFAEATRIALERAPALAARQADLDGAQSASQSADAPPDPRLLVGIDNLPISGPERFSTTREAMTMKRLGWMQEVPNADKRQARADAAKAEVAQARAALVLDRSNVRREVALAWLARYYAEQRLALFAALEDENRLLQQTIVARVAAGRALPADASMARQEALALADRRDELERARAQAAASLRRWVGAAAAQPLAGDPPELVPHAAHLLDNIDRHAELGTYEATLARTDAQTRELEASKRGDWSWEVMYGRRAPEYGDMVSVQLSFELPFWSGQRQDPLIAAKRQERARIDAERDDMRRRHAEEIEGMLAEHSALSQQLARAHDAAVPTADERVRLTLASYEAGRADLGAVLAARRDAAEARLRTIDLAAQQHAVRARLATLSAEEAQ